MSDHDRLRAELLELHRRVRRSVREALRTGALATWQDPAAGEGRVAAEGVGDVSFAIDVPAEQEVLACAERLNRARPLVLVTEEGGVRRLAPDTVEPELRLIADPIDGTRNLAFDLRSGWILTAAARERGAATNLQDVFLAVQSEIPARDSKVYHVLFAERGGGAWIERRDLESDALLSSGRLAAPPDARLDNGYYVFFKFSPEDRTVLAALEEEVLGALVREHGVDRRTLCDDQYISNGGQLFLLLTRRYRFVADLRGHVGDLMGVRNFTAKPYDVCCALLAEEAGCPLTDAFGRPLDAPLDASHRVSFLAYANQALRGKLEPLLHAALERLRERLPPPRSRPPEG